MFLCLSIAWLPALYSCSGSDKGLGKVALSDRRSIPVLEANDVSTLISDSGITRYRINAAQWLIYDKADPSYWQFPKGIYLEKFDEMLNINASLRSDQATYWEDDQIWLLQGHVYAVNEKGEIFETPEMYWDQKQQIVYSDSVIKITREQSIIEGVGFTSDQEMTKYTILRPTGFFPIKE